MRYRVIIKKVQFLSSGALHSLLYPPAALLAFSAQRFPNIPFKTLGGKQFWQDVHLFGGWRIQLNTLHGHYRLLDATNVRRTWGSREDCEKRLAIAKQNGEARLRGKELCLLIHGYGRSKDSFSGLRGALLTAGYEVYDLNYPSTQSSVAEIGGYVAHLYQAVENDFSAVHVITHSLGGLIARYALTHIPVSSQAKLIMIAPPNQGSVIEDKFLKGRVIARFGGPATQDLLPGSDTLLKNLGMPTCPCGVIAGVRGDGKGWNPLIPGEDDGLVGVDETQVEGRYDLKRIKSMHTYIMNTPETISAVLQFLRNGRFL